MHIQWFPGHMTKSLRMMEENIKLVDSVIYVIDSRAIDACINPSFDKLIANKTVLYILNKSDTVESTELRLWLNYIKDCGKTVITNDSTKNINCKKIVDLLMQINSEKIKRYAQKGAKMPIRAMIIGIPNCGKSTLANSLCGAKRATTGNRPGVTRGKQWINLGQGIELLDTPGTLSPSFEDQTLALHLAMIGSIKEDILNIEELSREILNYFFEFLPENLCERFKLDTLPENIEDLENIIARKRGFLLSGNTIDNGRLARAVIDDFRKQRLGKVMLEFPPEEFPEEFPPEII